ncbi:hypothetical protein AJ80_07407 [Polytolypa hystricis UAMH7299]|uniref:Uncharacterized protein n=1 Tax=Polytolypa hystricis (strain UAMH7299) TaxID=1447883 RepID=A0A2B7XQH8_POLH7|nr:hypothetical protein AJ80_07407 [Polytolypa hystricis UAMH7299]
MPNFNNELQISVAIPTANHLDLQEYELPANHNYSGPAVLNWSENAHEEVRRIMAPELQAFGICIRLSPGFIEMGDGIHITIKVDNGSLVNHCYSIKYDELGTMNNLWRNCFITRAPVQGEAGFVSNLFTFGAKAVLTSRSQQGPMDGILEGRITVTIIRVSHVRKLVALAHGPLANNEVPFGVPIQAQPQTDVQTLNIVPVVMANEAPPMVHEHAAPVLGQFGRAYRAVYIFNRAGVPVMDCVEKVNSRGHLTLQAPQSGQQQLGVPQLEASGDGANDSNNLNGKVFHGGRDLELEEVEEEEEDEEMEMAVDYDYDGDEESDDEEGNDAEQQNNGEEEDDEDEDVEEEDDEDEDVEEEDDEDEDVEEEDGEEMEMEDGDDGVGESDEEEEEEDIDYRAPRKPQPANLDSPKQQHRGRTRHRDEYEDSDLEL